LRIGVFDSGSGGLTVTRSLLTAHLFDEIIYYGDTARVPYGNKDKNTIIRYSMEALDFFEPFNIEMLIIACNTVSVTALEQLKKIAKYPVLGVVEPAIWLLERIAHSKEQRILIIGTNVTVASGIYQLSAYNRGYFNLEAISTGLLVSLVEEGIFDGPIMEASLNHYFSTTKRPEIIILACTHFPLVSEAISCYFPGSKLIHSGKSIVEWIKNNGIIIRPVQNDTKLQLFASDNSNRLKSNAHYWLGTVPYILV